MLPIHKYILGEVIWSKGFNVLTDWVMEGLRVHATFQIPLMRHKVIQSCTMRPILWLHQRMWAVRGRNIRGRAAVIFSILIVFYDPLSSDKFTQPKIGLLVGLCTLMEILIILTNIRSAGIQMASRNRKLNTIWRERMPAPARPVAHTLARAHPYLLLSRYKVDTWNHFLWYQCVKYFHAKGCVIFLLKDVRTILHSIMLSC